MKQSTRKLDKAVELMTYRLICTNQHGAMTLFTSAIAPSGPVGTLLLSVIGRPFGITPPHCVTDK